MLTRFITKILSPRWWLRVVSIGFLITFLINAWVILSTEKQIYTDINTLPAQRVGLVLGTAPKRADGSVNGHFSGRMQAAIELYKAGKVKHLIASGGKPEPYYNEQRAMLKALTQAGVPETDITLDFAGVRTLDSTVRAAEAYGQVRYVVVSQRYHLYRALFLANAQEQNVIAFVSPDPEFEQLWPVLVREYFARVAAVLDLYVLGTVDKVLSVPQPLQM